MSEPTARDRETARELVESWEYCSCSWCDRDHVGARCLTDRISAALAAERARVLTLTPDEAGRLYHDVWNQVNGEPYCPTWPHSEEEKGYDCEMGMAWLAALAARAEGA